MLGSKRAVGDLSAANDKPSRVLRVAYLVSEYPAPSHVFIEREILALRDRGVDVTTFSVRRTSSSSLLSERMREEATLTTPLLSPRAALVRACLVVARERPWGLLRTLVWALRTGAPHAKNRLWQAFYTAEACRLMLEMDRRGLRHVHAHFANNGADIARATVSLAGSTGRPGWSWSFTMHGPTEFEAVEHFDLAAKTADAAGVACISDFARSQLMRLTSRDHWSRLQTVPMSVDVDRFRPVTRAALVGRPLRVLFVGRLVPEKGPSVLLDATERLIARGVAVEVTIVGAGELAQTLEREVIVKGLETHVRLLGAIGQDEILDLYHRADVFCLPSFQEGLPVVIMEAMATGLPVVTTGIAGIPELVRDGENGYLVPPGRADLVSDVLQHVGEHPGVLAELGRCARAAVIDQHSTEVAVSRQEAFLRTVVGSLR